MFRALKKWIALVCILAVGIAAFQVVGDKQSGKTAEAAGVEELRGDVPVFLPFLFGERCPGWCDSRRAGFYQVKASHGSRN